MQDRKYLGQAATRVLVYEAEGLDILGLTPRSLDERAPFGRGQIFVVARRVEHAPIHSASRVMRADVGRGIRRQRLEGTVTTHLMHAGVAH
jgi:hypothetical protein